MPLVGAIQERKDETTSEWIHSLARTFPNLPPQSPPCRPICTQSRCIHNEARVLHPAGESWFSRADWVPLSTEEKDLMLRKALVELGGGDEMKSHFLSFLFHL